MNTKKKRFAPKKRLIKHFLALTLAGTLLLPGLVLIRCERVEANIISDMAGGVVGKLRYNATVAEIIISLMSGSGGAVTNTAYLNKLNQSYGIESTLATATGTDGTIGSMMDAGLFSISNDGTFVDNGLLSAIQSQPAYTECNVDSILGTWAESGAVEATAAENIGSSIGAAAAVGTVCQVAGAFMLGMSLGNVANNLKETFGAKIAKAQSLSNTSNIPDGYYYAFVTSSTTNYTCFTRDDTTIYWYLGNGPVGEGYGSYIFAVTKNNNSNKPYIYRNGTSYSNPGYGPFPIIQRGTTNSSAISTWENVVHVSSYQDIVAAAQNAESGSGDSPDIYSPDIIGSQGNQRADRSTTPISYPDLKDTVPDGKGVSVIPWDDYMDFVRDANNNTKNGETTINQGDTYNQFITNYYVTPERIPDVQTPDYNPTVPEQPTANIKPENTPEQNQQNTDYMTTPGLKDVFPFSIPWDIAGLFGVFSTNNREAPVVTFPIVSELFGIDEEITIDLSPYDDVAALLRLLELIAFGLGLAFVTRYLIGAGG